ncbi:MAG: JAB domain-containing protein [Bacteroidales bacterium]|nr:JAB domain-containing protein [Bacteroidales bacterium]
MEENAAIMEAVAETILALAKHSADSLLKELAVESETSNVIRATITLMEKFYPTYMRFRAHMNKITGPEVVYWACHDMLNLDREVIKVVSVGPKLNIVGIDMITMGILDCSICHPREVYRAAITRSAAGIVLVHNHPSGDCEPSEADRQMTAKIREAGEIIGIKMIDHIILSKGSLFSFKEDSVIDMVEMPAENE